MEGSNILALYRLVAPPEEVTRMEQDFRAGGIGYGEFKKRLHAAIGEYFAPMRERHAEFAARPDYVEDVLREGALRARKVAGEVMERVRTAVGRSVRYGMCFTRGVSNTEQRIMREHHLHDLGSDDTSIVRGKDATEQPRRNPADPYAPSGRSLNRRS